MVRLAPGVIPRELPCDSVRVFRTSSGSPVPRATFAITLGGLCRERVKALLITFHHRREPKASALATFRASVTRVSPLRPTVFRPWVRAISDKHLARNY